MNGQATVSKAYRRPYTDPIRVTAGDCVFPDFDAPTDIPGWVWCSGPRGRQGWTPRAWLEEKDGVWHITRDFDAIELSVTPGERVTLHFEHAGFHWLTTADGRTGWVPSDHLAPDSG